MNASSPSSEESQNLTGRSVRAAAWGMAFHFLRQFSAVLLGVLLVRILSPDDYGIMAKLTVFWVVGDVFLQGGFGMVLVQKKDPSPIEWDTVFYYNVFVGFLGYALMCAAAPWLADFFEQPMLRQIIPIAAWILPIGALGAGQRIILTRNLKLDVLARCSMFSFLISGGIAIFLAYRSAGVWALVWQQLSGMFFLQVFIFIHVRWVPRLRFSFAALRDMFRIGSGMLASELLTSVFDNIYNVVFGKRTTEAQLGYYNRAYSWTFLLPASIQGTVANVLFPAFSRLQDDPERLRSAFHRSLVVLMELTFFPTLMLGVLGYPFIELVLTPRWLPCMEFWWPLTLFFATMPIRSLNTQVLKARGKSGLVLWLELFFRGLTVLNIVCLYRAGVMPMVVGATVVTWIATFIGLLATQREIGYPTTHQLRNCLPCVAISTVCSWAAWGASMWIYPAWSWWGLILPATLGVTLYVVVTWWFQTESLRIVLNLAEPRLPKFARFWKICRWPATRRTLESFRCDDRKNSPME